MSDKRADDTDADAPFPRLSREDGKAARALVSRYLGFYNLVHDNPQWGLEPDERMALFLRFEATRVEPIATDGETLALYRQHVVEVSWNGMPAARGRVVGPPHDKWTPLVIEGMEGAPTFVESSQLRVIE